MKLKVTQQITQQITRTLHLVSLLLVVVFNSQLHAKLVDINAEYAVPNMLVMLDKNELARTKHAYTASGEYHDTIALMINAADEALKLGTFSVTSNSVLAASNDKHDYFSVGPYWWPNPKTKDGLPWVRQDGKTNPDYRGPDADNKKFQYMLAACHDLSIAYYFSGDDKYARKAQELMYAWFINSETKMNPHLNYAQSIPGKVAGRGIGIIEFRNLAKVLDAAVLIQPYTDAKFEAQFNEWVTILFAWLLESKNGQDEARMHNNHGTFYDMLVTSIALHLEYPEVATKISALTKKRIQSQVQEDGKQPHELSRTRPFNYTAFNILGLTNMAKMAGTLDINLWSHPASDDPRILTALQFAFANLDNKKLWPGKQEKRIEYYKLVAPALFARSAYSDNPEVSTQLDTFIANLASRSELAQQQLAVCSVLFNYPYSLPTSSSLNYRSCNY